MASGKEQRHSRRCGPIPGIRGCASISLFVTILLAAAKAAPGIPGTDGHRPGRRRGGGHVRWAPPFPISSPWFQAWTRDGGGAVEAPPGRRPHPVTTGQTGDRRCPGAGGGLDPNLEALLDLPPESGAGHPPPRIPGHGGAAGGAGDPRVLPGTTVSLDDLGASTWRWEACWGVPPRRPGAFVGLPGSGAGGLEAGPWGRGPPRPLSTWCGTTRPMTVGPGATSTTSSRLAWGENLFGACLHPLGTGEPVARSPPDPDCGGCFPAASAEDTGPRLEWIRNGPRVRELRWRSGRGNLNRGGGGALSTDPGVRVPPTRPGTLAGHIHP